jgi:hypothetical protein
MNAGLESPSPIVLGTNTEDCAMSLSTPSTIAHLNRLANVFKPSNKDQLHCRCSPPAMEVYIPYLVETFRLEALELLHASVYLRRLRHLRKRVKRVQRCTPYRLVLAALAVAHKYLRDNSYTNVDWGRGFHLSKPEMDKAELAMLKLLGWKLRISDEEQKAVEFSDFDHLKRPIRENRISLTREDAIIGT